MDWSLLEPHARYPILRRELVYKSHVSVRPQVSITLMALTVSQCYYFAIVRSRNRPDHGSNDNSSSQVFNVFVRFFWLRYIFVNKAHTTQDMFISALLEVLRRVQWNICTSFASSSFFSRGRDLGSRSTRVQSYQEHRAASRYTRGAIAVQRWRAIQQQGARHTGAVEAAGDPLRRKSFARSAQ